MFRFKFGLIWTLFTSIIFGFVIFVPADERNGAEMSFGLGLFFLLFEAIGIFMLVSGIKQILKDKKTSKYGIEAYGRILRIFPTGASANGVPELQAEIGTYIPDTGETREFTEITGFKPLYDVGDYLLLKYYEDDVNIVQRLEKNEVPVHFLEIINSKYLTKIDKDIIEIDGVKYKRIDDEYNW